MNHNYHGALATQQTVFKYHDQFVNKTYHIKTSLMQSHRRYRVNGFDIDIADHQIRNNKTYARINNLWDIRGLYKLVVNYNHVMVNTFNLNQNKEIAGVIYGLSHMNQYEERAFKRWRQAHYSEDYGIDLSDDEMALIVMFLRIAVHDCKNNYGIKMNLEALRISFIRMIKNEVPLNLTSDEAQELLQIVKHEGKILFNKLELSANSLKLIYDDIVHDLHSFIHPVSLTDRMRIELHESVKIAKNQSIRKALDYIFNERDSNKITDISFVNFIRDTAFNVIFDSFDNGQTFLLVDTVITNMKKIHDLDNQSKEILFRVKLLKKHGIKYVMSKFIRNGLNVDIRPVNKSNFRKLTNEMSNKIKELNY